MASLLNRLAPQRGIVRITRCRVAVEIFRPRLVEWCIKAYPLGKIGIRDVVSSERDQVTGSLGDEAGAMYGVNANIEDERTGVEATEVMHYRVPAHMLDWSAREIRHLPHQKHVR